MDRPCLQQDQGRCHRRLQVETAPPAVEEYDAPSQRPVAVSVGREKIAVFIGVSKLANISSANHVRIGCGLQASNNFCSGCGTRLTAAVPPSRWSSTGIEVVAKILGQLCDWGKSQQALDRLFGDLQRLPVAA